MVVCLHIGILPDLLWLAEPQLRYFARLVVWA